MTHAHAAPQTRHRGGGVEGYDQLITHEHRRGGGAHAHARVRPCARARLVDVILGARLVPLDSDGAIVDELVEAVGAQAEDARAASQGRVRVEDAVDGAVVLPQRPPHLVHLVVAHAVVVVVGPAVRLAVVVLRSARARPACGGT
eukprot:6992986-Prymnesium_polylepis.1